MKTMKKDDQPKKNTKLKWIAILVALTFILVHAKLRHVKVPSELVGTWHTNVSSYADRSFEIGYETVNFDLGEGAVSTGFVEDIQATPAAHGILYVVSYKADGVTNQVSFYYDGNGDKTIHFKNQDLIIWTKDADSSASM